MHLDQMKNDILQLKKEKDAVILVHNYQRPEIQDLADFLGDSLGLSRKAAETSGKRIIFCGVQFMAETAKILSPDKMVLLPRKDAGCPMANMVAVEDLIRLKAKHPNAVVVTYVNSTAEVKAESDVCCTSANAVQVVQNVKEDEIIFTPDRNLAAYVQRFTNKKIIPWEGYCYVHDQFTKDEIVAARQSHPDAVIIVHPECPPEVIDESDEILSTSGMVRFAKESTAKTMIVGTEEGLLYRLKTGNPGKTFLTLGTAKMCRGMKLTRLKDLHQALLKDQYQISLSENIIYRARSALEKMLHYV